MTIRPVALALLFAAALVLPVHAETIDGSGRPATQQRAAQGIDGVAVSLSSEVTLTQGKGEGVKVTADGNLLPYIETVVENGILRIRSREGTSLSARTPIRIAVTARAPQLIAVSGSARLEAPALALGRLEAKLAGSGRMRLAGAAKLVVIHVSGSGDVDAARLVSQDASVSVSGSGRARVAAQKTLSATVAGSGAVAYYGDPKVEQRVTGSGGVHRAGDRAP